MSKITVHQKEMHFRGREEDNWEVREPNGTYGTGHKQCSYCGSLNPLDLLHLLKNVPAIALQNSDWKYGWPHKFYVAGVPNPKAGEIVKTGARCYTNDAGERVEEPFMNPASATLTVKFYNVHLVDFMNIPEFGELTDLIWKYTGVHFVNKEEKLMYQCLPYGETWEERERRE